MRDRLNIALALVALTAAAFALAACGRNGYPLPPPGPQAAAPATPGAPPAQGAAAAGLPPSTGPMSQETAQKNGFDFFGNPVAPTTAKKSFLLDPILQ